MDGSYFCSEQNKIKIMYSTYINVGFFFENVVKPELTTASDSDHLSTATTFGKSRFHHLWLKKSSIE